MVDRISRIVDRQGDTDFPTDVRVLLGITTNELSDAEIKSDMIHGIAERNICKTYVPNWQTVVNGDDAMAAEALRACVIIKAALNIIGTPAIQNILIDEVRLIDVIIKAKKVSLEELRRNLERMLNEQLVAVGVEHTGDWPEFTIIGKTDNDTIYGFEVDTSGDIVSA